MGGSEARSDNPVEVLNVGAATGVWAVRSASNTVYYLNVDLGRLLRVPGKGSSIDPHDGQWVEFIEVRGPDYAGQVRVGQRHQYPIDPDPAPGAIADDRWWAQQVVSVIEQVERGTLAPLHDRAGLLDPTFSESGDRAAFDPDAAEGLVVAQAARELGTVARQESPGAPWVIVGTVDGRGFYLTGRSEIYRVVLAPDGQPGLDPWSAPPTDRVLTVAQGVTADFLDDTGDIDARKAVHTAVAAARTYLRQPVCTHPGDPTDRYCRQCGTPLTNPALP